VGVSAAVRMHLTRRRSCLRSRQVRYWRLHPCTDQATLLVWKECMVLLGTECGMVQIAWRASRKDLLVLMRCEVLSCRAAASEEYMLPRRNFSNGAPKAMWFNFPMSTLA